MKKYTSFQATNFVKSFTLFFFGLTFLGAVGNYIAIRDVLISWPVFIVNFILSTALGWWHYRQRYHLVFSYDADSFILQVGKKILANRWVEYTAVSLFHPGRGDLFVRLYQKNGEFIEIPASLLRLNPSEFRFEVMDFIEKATGRKDGR
jgi:hypothetical protein